MKNILLGLIVLLANHAYAIAEVVVIPLFEETIVEKIVSSEFVVTDQNDVLLGTMLDFSPLFVLTDKGYRYELGSGSGDLYGDPGEVFYSGAGCSGIMYEKIWSPIPILTGIVRSADSNAGPNYISLEAQLLSNISVASCSNDLGCNVPQHGDGYCLTPMPSTLSNAYQLIPNDPSVTGAPFASGLTSVPGPIKIKRSTN